MIDMLQIYKDIASELHIKVHPNTGEAKLKEKLQKECELRELSLEEYISEKIDKLNEPKLDLTSKKSEYDNLPEHLKNLSLEDLPDPVEPNESMKLVRVIITPNDPNRSGSKCEIRTVANVRMSYTKAIPYNTPTHIPNIMLNSMKETKYQRVVTSNDPVTGKEIQQTVEANAYNIEVLPPLTEEEFKAIAQQQLARK